MVVLAAAVVLVWLVAVVWRRWVLAPLVLLVVVAVSLVVVALPVLVWLVVVVWRRWVLALLVLLAVVVPLLVVSLAVVV